MAEVVVLALALSMDAFAVSVGLGSKCGASPGLALRCALYFGVFQGLMPLLGYLAGRGALGWFAAWAPWIACGLLVAIGGRGATWLESRAELLGGTVLILIGLRILFV